MNEIGRREKMDWLTPEEVAEYRAHAEREAEKYAQIVKLFRDADAGDERALLILKRNGALPAPRLIVNNGEW